MSRQLPALSRAAAGTGPDLPPAPSARPQVLLGAGVGIGGFLAVVLWLFTAKLAGAVVAPGIVVVEGEVKKIQHQAGGIVSELPVRDGDRVTAGQVVMTLDETILRSSLGQVESQLIQLGARRARLEAERDGRDRLALPADFPSAEAEARQSAEREQLYLTESRATRAQQAAQLDERIGQFEREVEGLTAQAEAKSAESELISVELRGVQELFQRNLVPISRATALQREVTRLGGERGALVASMAKARGQIAEIRLQLLSIDQRARADAVKELGDVEAAIAQLVEKRVAALDLLRRAVIRAPQSGIVHQLAVHTIGGVVAPGATLMQIVPDQDRMTVEFRVSPTDIDQLRLDQKVILRFSAFNQRTTPEITARLTRLSPDATRETQTGAIYFVARAGIEPGEMEKLGKLVIGPGMPAEVFVETGERTAVSYFLKPLGDAFSRAFREE